MMAGSCLFNANSRKIAKVAAAILAIFIIAQGLLHRGEQPSSSEINLAMLPPVAVGDWVLRTGTSAESQIIQQVDGGSNYSHIGMVVSLNPTMVVHATTDDNPKLPNQVLLTSLQEFLNPTLASDFALVRPTFLSIQEKERMASGLINQVGKGFVLTPKAEAPRYCTTILLDEIQKIQPTFTLQWTSVNVPVFNGEYLFPSQFYNYPDGVLIYSSKGKTSFKATTP